MAMRISDNMNKGQQAMTPVKNDLDVDEYYMTPRLEEDFRGIITTLSNIDKFGTKMGNRNYLFTGPPGTGKTMGIKFIAKELGFPIYDGKLVLNADGITQTFADLRKKAAESPLILMINEVDKFSSREEVVDPTQRQLLNQLLDEMDGAESNHRIYIFGTTNQADKIDIALRRPGRFSKEISIMPPDRKGRFEILKSHAIGKGGHKFHLDAELIGYAAGVTFGYTGADLVGLLNEAFTQAMVVNEDEGGRRNIKIEGEDMISVIEDDIKFALKRTKPTAIRDMPFREPKIKLGDIGGYRSHVEVMKRIFDKSDGSMCLFYGPPGTGKTNLPEALAGEYGYNFMVVSGSEPEDKFVGETGKKIDKYIERAKQLAPCILLFDELDSLVEKKGVISHKDSGTGILQSRLSRGIEGVHIIGTMNRPDLINDTFIQRFIHKLYFGLPTPEEQVEIWMKYLPKELIDKAKELVEFNPNLTPRNIAHTSRIIADYGLEPSLDVYKHLIADIKYTPDANYDKIRKSTGDSIVDYEKVRKLSQALASGKGLENVVGESR